VWGWGGAAPLSCRRNLTPARDEAAGGCGPRTGGSDEDGGAAFAKCSRSDFNCSGQEGGNSPPTPATIAAGRRVAAPAALPTSRDAPSTGPDLGSVDRCPRNATSPAVLVARRARPWLVGPAGCDQRNG